MVLDGSVFPVVKRKNFVIRFYTTSHMAGYFRHGV
jgi:hypothetical protein